MAKINLLPWREWERERKKNEFVTNLAVVLVVAGVLIWGAGFFLDSSIDNQNKRNRYVQQEIDELDKRIAEIRDLKEQREQLLARMQVIQDLQGNRPIIVRVFDELVRTLPEKVYFTRVRMIGHQIQIEGTAATNSRISELMRRVDASGWLADPNLLSIKRNPRFGDQASDFEMTVNQVNPKTPNEEEA